MSVQSDRDYYFSMIAKKIGGKRGVDIVDALADLYSLQTPNTVEWYARLFDPAVGGWYYSNGARDLGSVVWEGKEWQLYPDIESTEQALRFISGSGLAGNSPSPSYAHVLPEWVKKKVLYYLKSLQHENGFFYNPQWGRELTDRKLSRRARDLGNAVSVIKCLGDAPTYDTPIGDKGNGILANGERIKLPEATVAKEVPSSCEVAVPEHMRDKEAFLEYLSTLNIGQNSYSVGNTLTAQKAQIIYRDSILKQEGKDYSLMDILIGWLNENQLENGLWDEVENYHAVNGLMKISGVYGAAKVLIPNAEKAAVAAINAMSTEEIPGAVTAPYNTWFAAERVIRHVRTHGGEDGEKEARKILDLLYDRAPEALRKTKEKLSVFKKPDGSYSYTPSYSSARSQGCPVTHEKMVEGDVNATVICTSDILSYIYGALDLRELKAPLYGKADMERYIEILNEGARSMGLSL